MCPRAGDSALRPAAERSGPEGARPLPPAPQGIVTRVNDVKPLMEFACYTCDDCGFEIYQARDLLLLAAQLARRAALRDAAGGARAACVHAQLADACLPPPLSPAGGDRRQFHAAAAVPDVRRADQRHGRAAEPADPRLQGARRPSAHDRARTPAPSPPRAATEELTPAETPPFAPRWFLQFLKFQEIKLQEMSEDVPMGHIPRAMTVQARPHSPAPTSRLQRPRRPLGKRLTFPPPPLKITNGRSRASSCGRWPRATSSR